LQRIGIDARFLLSNPRSAHAALLWELLSYNVVHPLPSVFVLYTNTRLHEIGSLAANNVRICYVPDRPGISDFFWLNSRLPAQLKRDSIDTYVSCFYKIPLRCCATTINMIHDTAFFDVCPERLIGKHRSRYYRLALLLSLRLHCGRASRVITVSNYSRDRIAKHLHLSRSKMAVCYNAVSRGFYAPQGEPNVRLELPKDYCLFVGSAQAKKNMDGMLRAFSMLPEILRRRFPLVLRSTPGADIIAIIDHLGLSENVIIMRDHLDEAHHCALVRSAAVVVLLSFDEGFGLPVAEAMAAGVPVLTSSGGALPEITNHLGGDHSPDSLSDISRAWELILVDSLRREEVIAAGKELSQRYHPDVVAPHFFELILTA
jgi:glycosyltransferase involved in cell wall biosynthesis